MNTPTSTTKTNFQTLQLWPSGQSVTYAGEFPGYSIRENGTERPATTAESTAIRIEELARRYSDIEILACQSHLVNKLMQDEVFSIDDIEGLYPDPSNWTLEECRDFLDEYVIDRPDPDPWRMDAEECIELLEVTGHDANTSEPIEDLRSAVIASIDAEDIDGIDDWRDAVRDNAEPREIMEWWLVSPWLCDELRRIGQPVIDNDYGCWWGRCCTGQGYLMDGTLQRIAKSYVPTPAEGGAV